MHSLIPGVMDVSKSLTKVCAGASALEAPPSSTAGLGGYEAGVMKGGTAQVSGRQDHGKPTCAPGEATSEHEPGSGCVNGTQLGGSNGGCGSGGHPGWGAQGEEFLVETATQMVETFPAVIFLVALVGVVFRAVILAEGFLVFLEVFLGNLAVAVIPAEVVAFQVLMEGADQVLLEEGFPVLREEEIQMLLLPDFLHGWAASWPNKSRSAQWNSHLCRNCRSLKSGR